MNISSSVRILAAAIALVAVAAADVASLAAQATSEVGDNSVEFGLGAGGGTGRFGGPGIAALFYVGGASPGFALGAEMVGLFRREHYASGGAFFRDPGRTRTMTRWALNIVGRFNSAAGPFAKVGVGVGVLTDIDTSVLDAVPLKSFTTLVTSVGVGTRLSLGGISIAPRGDLLLHLGHGVRATGIGGLAVALF
jgi:hypothetical protein